MPKTVKRANENLKGQKNVTLICGDFMSYDFGRKNKNHSNTIEYGTRVINVYPDCKEDIAEYINQSGMSLIKIFETEFAHILSAEKNDPITVSTKYREKQAVLW